MKKLLIILTVILCSIYTPTDNDIIVAQQSAKSHQQTVKKSTKKSAKKVTKTTIKKKSTKKIVKKSTKKPIPKSTQKPIPILNLVANQLKIKYKNNKTWSEWNTYECKVLIHLNKNNNTLTVNNVLDQIFKLKYLKIDKSNTKWYASQDYENIKINITTKLNKNKTYNIAFRYNNYIYEYICNKTNLTNSTNLTNPIDTNYVNFSDFTDENDIINLPVDLPSKQISNITKIPKIKYTKKPKKPIILTKINIQEQKEINIPLFFDKSILITELLIPSIPPDKLTKITETKTKLFKKPIFKKSNKTKYPKYL